jgi:hypothetical protein
MIDMFRFLFGFTRKKKDQGEKKVKRKSTWDTPYWELTDGKTFYNRKCHRCHIKTHWLLPYPLDWQRHCPYCGAVSPPPPPPPWKKAR